MPRKGPAPRRELMPDPIYRSVLVTQLANKILQRVKRSVAERNVYDALDQIHRELGTTTAIITHNAAIAGMADRVVTLADGQVHQVVENREKLAPADLEW